MKKLWNNGDTGGVVKKVIEDNFEAVSKHLPHNVLALSTVERNMLTSAYLSDGLIVFDTTRERWFRYKKGQWSEYDFTITGDYYTLDILSGDWVNGQITIPFEDHKITSPVVELLMLNNRKYDVVLGGVSVDLEGNVTLSSDINFNGRVVIK